MVVLYFGDIFARPGRRAIELAIGQLREKYKPDFIFGNAENLAGGRGVNQKTFREICEFGFDGFSSGNHIWDNPEVYKIMSGDSRLIRPANFPSPGGRKCPGRGYNVFESNGKKLLLINVMGRIFMDPLDCPFRAVDQILSERGEDMATIVDMHAETTSEKYAMGWHLAGRVSAMVGTHTHVQTADDRILTGGTAYITDIGLSGSFDSVIGLRSKEIVEKFITKRRVPYQVASDNLGVCAVVIKIGPDHRAQSIERIRLEVGEDGAA